MLRVLDLVKVSSGKWYSIEHGHSLSSLQKNDNDMESNKKVSIPVEENPAAAVSRAAEESLLLVQRLQTDDCEGNLGQEHKDLPTEQGPALLLEHGNRKVRVEVGADEVGVLRRPHLVAVGLATMLLSWRVLIEHGSVVGLIRSRLLTAGLATLTVRRGVGLTAALFTLRINKHNGLARKLLRLKQGTPLL